MSLLVRSRERMLLKKVPWPEQAKTVDPWGYDSVNEPLRDPSVLTFVKHSPGVSSRYHTSSSFRCASVTSSCCSCFGFTSILSFCIFLNCSRNEPSFLKTFVNEGRLSLETCDVDAACGAAGDAGSVFGGGNAASVDVPAPPRIPSNEVLGFEPSPLEDGPLAAFALLLDSRGWIHNDK